MDKGLIFLIMVDMLLEITLIISLIIIMIYDMKQRVISNRFLIVLAIVRVMLFFVLHDFTLLKLLEITVVISIGILVYRILKGKIGAGDIKLIFVISLYLTTKEFIYAIFITMLFMLLSGIVLLCFKEANKKSFVPLSPFIALGTIIALVAV